MGEAAFAEATDPNEGAAGILRPSASFGHASGRTEPPWPLARQAEGEPFMTGETLPGHKEGSLNPIRRRFRASTAYPGGSRACSKLNLKLRSL